MKEESTTIQLGTTPLTYRKEKKCTLIKWMKVGLILSRPFYLIELWVFRSLALRKMDCKR